jgi:protein-tyrosine phosphatase
MRVSLPVIMVDLHSHVLPGFDDGAKDLGEALEMCRMAESDGIKILAATPHFRPAVYESTQDDVLAAVAHLQQELEGEGISLKLVPGADIHISPEAFPFLGQNPRLLFGGRYALIEFSADFIPPSIEDFLFRMRLRGITPIVSHPERNREVQNDTKALERMVNSGVLIQVTAMSLTGGFGDQARATAFRLVKSGLAHIIASDAHSPRHRVPVLSKARKTLETLVGLERARMMVEETPQKILQGEPIEPPEIREDPLQTRSSLLRRFLRGRS